MVGSSSSSSGEKPRQKTAVVIGAGAGGISTAARLARAGLAVTVVEKNTFTGGRCSLLHSDGHRFDQGPSLLLLPQLFHRTFADLGTSLVAEGVELRKCEPNYHIWFGDGGKFRLSSDVAVMKDEVERVEGKEGFERYLAWLQEAHAHYEVSVREVLLRNFTGLGSMFRVSFLRHLLQLHPFESIWTRASKYFWSERLRRVFTFGSMYMGMSPFDAPGTYSLLQYTELAEGIWYPVGGFHRVLEALVGIGEREGVEFRMGEGVGKILLEENGGKAVGVELENGEVLRADVVVNNSDLVYAYKNLLPPSPYADALAQRPGSCSSISFYWGLSQQVPQLETHNIFLADQYRESFDSIFKKHLIPDEPSFYVNVPSRVDPSAAPTGKDTVTILVPVGHLLDTPASPTTPSSANGSPSTASSNPLKDASPQNQPGLAPAAVQDWTSMTALARQTILATIHARTGVDMAPLITTELANTPATWRDNFNLDRGSILGLSHSFFNVLCFRPSTKARISGGAVEGKLEALLGGGALGIVAQVLADAAGSVVGRRTRVQGLYMVGASAHPGTGVPIVLAGGRLVAEEVLADLGMVVPWQEKMEGQEERKRKLDQLAQPLWLDSWGQWMEILIAVAIALVAWALATRGA